MQNIEARVILFCIYLAYITLRTFVNLCLCDEETIHVGRLDWRPLRDYWKGSEESSRSMLLHTQQDPPDSCSTKKDNTI